MNKSEFKNIRDTLEAAGHRAAKRAGETILREVADRLAELLRREIRKCTGNTCHCAEINEALADYRKAAQAKEQPQLNKE